MLWRIKGAIFIDRQSPVAESREDAGLRVADRKQERVTLPVSVHDCDGYIFRGGHFERHNRVDLLILCVE